ncbi:hypothetical protein PG997_009756 [Apiospora hydei]|uniref:Uncharacterized protein n=1 Tax=Apiospora hydei TaxID=1337664 RepID=A0ABR1VZ15_9PEZI
MDLDLMGLSEPDSMKPSGLTGDKPNGYFTICDTCRTLNIESLMAETMFSKPKFSCDLCSPFGRDAGTFLCVFDDENEKKCGAAANTGSTTPRRGR